MVFRQYVSVYVFSLENVYSLLSSRLMWLEWKEGPFVLIVDSK